MSMMQLLSAGKSLVGLHDTHSRYQLRTKNTLPKFGPVRNPFVTTAEPVVAKADAGVPKTYQLNPAELAAANLKETKRIPVAVEIFKKTTRLPTLPPARRAEQILSRIAALARGGCEWAGDQARKLPQLVARRKPAPAPKLSGAVIQAELSLDRVQVVRNDLSDADVEVVPAQVKPLAAPTPAPAQATAAVEVPKQLAGVNG